MGQKVGVIGLGNMGRGIAKNIAKGGHTLLACSEAGQLAEAAGIELADMIQVFNAGNARSFISERRFPDHIKKPMLGINVYSEVNQHRMRQPLMVTGTCS